MKLAFDRQEVFVIQGLLVRTRLPTRASWALSRPVTATCTPAENAISTIRKFKYGVVRLDLNLW